MVQMYYGENNTLTSSPYRQDPRTGTLIYNRAVPLGVAQGDTRRTTLQSGQTIPTAYIEALHSGSPQQQREAQYRVGEMTGRSIGGNSQPDAPPGARVEFGVVGPVPAGRKNPTPSVTYSGTMSQRRAAAEQNIRVENQIRQQNINPNSFQAEAIRQAANRPGYYGNTGDSVSAAAAAGLTMMSLFGMADPRYARSPEYAEATAMEMLRQHYDAGGRTRQAQYYSNELQKTVSRPIERASAYHNLGMAAGIPVPANPWEFQSDMAVEFLKGQPQKSSESFSPVSGLMSGSLPGAGYGLQMWSWDVALNRDRPQKYAAAPAVSFAPALSALYATENKFGPYGSLFGGDRYVGSPSSEGIRKQPGFVFTPAARRNVDAAIRLAESERGYSPGLGTSATAPRVTLTGRVIQFGDIKAYPEAAGLGRVKGSKTVAGTVAYGREIQPLPGQVAEGAHADQMNSFAKTCQRINQSFANATLSVASGGGGLVAAAPAKKGTKTPTSIWDFTPENSGLSESMITRIQLGAKAGTQMAALFLKEKNIGVGKSPAAALEDMPINSKARNQLPPSFFNDIATGGGAGGRNEKPPILSDYQKSILGGYSGGLLGYEFFGEKSPEVIKGLVSAGVSDATLGLVKIGVKGSSEQYPYGEFSKWSESAGKQVMARRGFSETQLDIYGRTLENKPVKSIQDVTDRLSYGFVRTMAKDPGQMASGALAGVSWFVGAESIGGVAGAVAAGGGRAAPYANALIKASQTWFGKALPLTVFGGATIYSATEGGKASVSKTLINFGATTPGLTSMAVGGIGAGMAMRLAPPRATTRGRTDGGVTLPKDTFGIVTERGELSILGGTPDIAVLSSKGYRIPFKDFSIFNTKTGEMILPPPESIRIESSRGTNVRYGSSVSTDIRAPKAGDRLDVPILDLRENLALMGEKTGPFAVPTVKGVAGKPSGVSKISLQKTPSFGIKESLSYKTRYAKTQLGMAFPRTAFFTGYATERTLPNLIKTMGGLSPFEPAQPKRMKPFDLSWYAEKTKRGKAAFDAGKSQILATPEVISSLVESGRYSNAMMKIYRRAPLAFSVRDVMTKSTSEQIKRGAYAQQTTRRQDRKTIPPIIPFVTYTRGTRHAESQRSKISPALFAGVMPAMKAAQVVSPISASIPDLRVTPIQKPRQIRTTEPYLPKIPPVIPKIPPYVPTTGGIVVPLPPLGGGGMGGGIPVGRGRWWTEIFRTGFGSITQPLFGRRSIPRVKKNKQRSKKWRTKK